MRTCLVNEEILLFVSRLILTGRTGEYTFGVRGAKKTIGSDFRRRYLGPVTVGNVPKVRREFLGAVKNIGGMVFTKGETAGVS